jgi:hypothetical protein
MKTILFPVYHDIDKLSIYKNVIPEDYHVIIYEKKDIQYVEKVKTVLDFHPSISQYHIPSIGEQHFALVLYIIRNYNTLHGTLHFSKTNWIPTFSSAELFKNDLLHLDATYQQHTTTTRKMVYIFEDKQNGYKEGIMDIINENTSLQCNLSMIHSYNRNCVECNNNLPCHNCGAFEVDGLRPTDCERIIFISCHTKKNHFIIRLLKEIFPTFVPKTEYNPCVIDTSYKIDTKLILYHPKEVYIKLLDATAPMSHDECCIFFHLFFKETLSLLNGWNKLPI